MISVAIATKTSTLSASALTQVLNFLPQYRDVDHISEPTSALIYGMSTSRQMTGVLRHMGTIHIIKESIPAYDINKLANLAGTQVAHHKYQGAD